jgi:hypothetical protein
MREVYALPIDGVVGAQVSVYKVKASLNSVTDQELQSMIFNYDTKREALKLVKQMEVLSC